MCYTKTKEKVAFHPSFHDSPIRAFRQRDVKNNGKERLQNIMRILLVEDDETLNHSLAFQLEAEGFLVDTCRDGEEALYYMEEHIHDLVLLDRMLPLLDGTELLAQMRQKNNNTPVILITALGTLNDKITGLDLGADDYITKPFGVMELMSRIKAIMRRIKPTSDDMVLKYKNIYLDQDRRICLVDEENVELTFKEYELLRLFLSNLGIVLTREIIMETVWGTDFAGESRTIDMHIKTLRKKLKEAGSLIITVRNVGYKLE